MKAIAATSDFLKAQGKIPAVLSDYKPYVTAKFVKGRGVRLELIRLERICDRSPRILQLPGSPSAADRLLV